MAYIGKEPSFGAFEKDIFTGDGSTTQFTLTHNVASATSIIVSLGGVIQEPVAAYTIVDNTIIFAAPPAVGTNFFAIVLATNAMTPLKSLSIGTRNSTEKLDIHGATFSVLRRTGNKIPVAFNVA